MEDLRALGKIAVGEWDNNFEEFKKGDGPKLPDRVRESYPQIITITPNGYNSEHATQSAVPSKLQENAAAIDASTSSLQMVVLAKDGDDTLLVSKTVFDHMFESFNLDPVIRQHVFLNSYGFHYYQHAEPFRGGHTFFFGCFLYSIAWSFHPETMKTSAILILRTIERHKFGELPFKTFEACLKRYSGRLHTPFPLAFAAFVHVTHVLDENMYRVVDDLRKIEKFTKHGPTEDSSQEHQARFPHGIERQTTVMKLDQSGQTINQLDKHSRALANANVHLANLQRHASLLMDMADRLEDETFLTSYCAGVPSQHADAKDREVKDFRSIVPTMVRRIKTSKPSLEYLHDRAKSQFQVVFSLLTHEDAEVNIKVAKDSKVVAEAAKKDSAAMKTIAFMTMLFLPGTFYAALFAIPTLNWEKNNPEKVIQSGFEIYWAFTIPSTVFILFLWFVWDPFRARIKEIWNKLVKLWRQPRRRSSHFTSSGHSSSADIEMNGANGTTRSRRTFQTV